jgi:hypothetical protein
MIQNKLVEYVTQFKHCYLIFSKFVNTDAIVHTF